MLKKESTYAKIIHWLSLVVFTGLFLVGVSVTGYNFEVYAETVWLQGNDIFEVLIMLILGSGVLLGISKLYDKCLSKVNPVVVTTIFAILTYAVAALWVVVSKAVPQADQLTVYNIANEMNTELSEPITQTSYIVFFPYQLGIVSFLRILIKIFGYGNYVPVQLVFALCAPTIVIAGSGILKAVFGKEKAGKINFIYGFICFLCLPIYFYSTFIYGDLPFAAMSLVLIWLVYLCFEKPTVIRFILLFFAAGINYLLKVNALIVVLAVSIYLVISLFKKDKRTVAIIALVSMLLGVFSLNKINQAAYSDVIPKEYSSLPFIATVVMGMNDDWGRAGWCNFYHQNVFCDNDCDPVLTKIQCMEDMKSILKHWAKHPFDTIHFFYKKINLQWNAPFYQSLVMNSTHIPDNQPKLGKLIYESFPVHLGLQKFMKVFQLTGYGFIAASLWITRKKEESLKAYIPMIAVFGSFLFSLIWESKTRYQMPALVLMLPCFAMAVPVVFEYVKQIKTVPVSDYFDSKSYERKNHNGIDLVKFLMALVVVAIHVMPQVNLYTEEKVSVGKAFDNFYSMAVPFFFMAAGFLLAEKLVCAADKNEKFKIAKKYTLRMIKLYVIWNIIYSPFLFFFGKTNQFTFAYGVKDYIHTFFFTGSFYNAYILWYLLSSVYGMIAILVYLKLDVKKTTMIFWTVAFMALSLSFSWIGYIADPSEVAAIPYGKSFGPLLKLVSATFGSGKMLTGLFYLPLGMLLFDKKISAKWGVLSLLIGYGLTFTSVFDDLGTILMTVGLFVVARQVQLKDGVIWKYLRNISTGMYFIHLYVWTLLYYVLHRKKTFGPSMYFMTVGACIVICFVFYFVKSCLNKGKNKGV